MDSQKTKHDDFDKTKFAAKSGLIGMGADIATDVATNSAAFYKNNKDKIQNIMSSSGNRANKIKQIASMPETKELAKHLKSQQKGSLGLSAAFAAGTTAVALNSDFKKRKEKTDNMSNEKIAQEVEKQEKVTAESGRMSSIPGTPDWIRANKSSK